MKKVVRDYYLFQYHVGSTSDLLLWKKGHSSFKPKSALNIAKTEEMNRCPESFIIVSVDVYQSLDRFVVRIPGTSSPPILEITFSGG